MKELSILTNERGVALITVMMLMVILLLIGLAATDTTIMERQIATNEVAYRRGFYKADAGISYARTLSKSDVQNKDSGVELPVPTDAPFTLKIYSRLMTLNAAGTEQRYAVKSESVESDFDSRVVIIAEIQLPAAGARPPLPGHAAVY